MIFTDEEVIKMVIECQAEGSWSDELSSDAILEFAQKVAMATLRKREALFDEWWVEYSGTLPSGISQKQAKRIWLYAVCSKGM